MIKHSSRQFGDLFQDLVAKVKNLVALAPVLGAISRPAREGHSLLKVFVKQLQPVKVWF